MYRVDNIERVHTGGVHIRRCRRRSGEVRREVEDVAQRRLAGGRTLRALEGDGIVARGVSGCGRAITLPAIRRRSQVLRVCQQLETLRRGLFCDGQHEVLHSSSVKLRRHIEMGLPY